MSRITKPLMAAVAVLLSAALFTCAGIAPASQTAAGPSFTGDGGRGMSLAVLIPEGRGIAADQNYLPTMVQGVLVSDLTKYSAISVLDRVRLETVLRETESGIYRNEADYGRLGQIANVDYALTGSITRTGSGYAMQIQVVGTGRNTIGVTKAAYSGTCTIAEFDNFTGIRKASLELLTQMGVALTASARNELSGAAQANFVNAQASLAQGIAAQRGGNEFQAMLDYFDARISNPNMQEASLRMANATTTLVSNNWTNTGARAQVMGEIEQMREAQRLEEERKRNMAALLDRANKFYREHQPYVISIDSNFLYGTPSMSPPEVRIGVSMRITIMESEFKIINELKRQASSIGIGFWPVKFRMIGLAGLISDEYYDRLYKERLSSSRRYGGIWDEVIDRSSWAYLLEGISTIPPRDTFTGFEVVADILNNNGKILRRGVSFYFSCNDDFIRTPAYYYFNIPANDLTDNLTMRISSIYKGDLGVNFLTEEYDFLSNRRRITGNNIGIEHESRVLQGRRSDNSNLYVGIRRDSRQARTLR